MTGAFLHPANAIPFLRQRGAELEEKADSSERFNTFEATVWSGFMDEAPHGGRRGGGAADDIGGGEGPWKRPGGGQPLGTSHPPPGKPVSDFQA